MDLSFRARMTAWNLVVMTTLFLLAMGGMYLGARATMLHDIDRDLQQRSTEMTHFLWKNHDRRGMHDSQVTWKDAFYRSSGVAPGEELYQLQDDTGAWLYQSPAMKDLAIPGASPDLQNATHLAFLSRRQHDFRALTQSVIVAKKTYVFQLASPIDAFFDVLGRLRTIGAITLPFLLLAASFASYWLSGRAIAPVAKITATARRLSEQNLSERIPLPRVRDELHELSSTLNETFVRLEASFRQVRQFTADASHELRTPVSVIRATAEVAVERRRESKEYEAMLRVILDEVETLSQLIEHLLILARVDSGLVQAPLTVASLDEVMEDIHVPACTMAASRNLLLTFDTACGQARVLTHRPTLKRTLLVFIENACQYTPMGGSIRICANQAGEHVFLEIRDTGIGVPEADLPRLFERFFRGTHARELRPDGSGLGLSIAHSLAGRLGAIISIESVPMSGTAVRLRLNRAEASDQPLATGLMMDVQTSTS